MYIIFPGDDLTFKDFLTDIKENHGAEVESEDGVYRIWVKDEHITATTDDVNSTLVSINTIVEGGPHTVKAHVLYNELGIDMPEKTQ